MAKTNAYAGQLRRLCLIEVGASPECLYPQRVKAAAILARYDQSQRMCWSQRAAGMPASRTNADNNAETIHQWCTHSIPNVPVDGCSSFSNILILLKVT